MSALEQEFINGVNSFVATHAPSTAAFQPELGAAVGAVVALGSKVLAAKVLPLLAAKVPVVADILKALVQ